MIPELYQKVVVGFSIICVFVCMLKEYATPEVAFLCALSTVTLLGILPLEDALSGFSNPSVVTIGSLFIVVGAVDKTGLMAYGARSVFGVKSSARIGTVRMLGMTFSLSSVFNNTPLVALMIPIVRDWARAKGIPLSQLLMPLSYVAIAGGLLTMIGTSTSLTVQGLLIEDRGAQFSFFAPGVISLPCGLLLIAYLVWAAPFILPAHSGLIREARDHTSDLIAEVQLTSNSLFAGRDIGHMLAQLGVPASNAIKIRRQIPLASGRDDHPAGDVDVEAGKSNVILSSDLDVGVELSLLPSPSVSVRRGRTVSVGDVRSEKSAAEHAAELGVDTIQAHVNVSVDDMIVDSRRTADSAYVERSLEAWGQIQLPSSTLMQPRASVKRSSGSNNGYIDIIAPGPREKLQDGDIVFVSSAQELVTRLLTSLGGEGAGLQILDSSVLDLPGYGSELVELVISAENPFVGKKLAACAPQFSEKYKVGIISTRARITAGAASSAASASSPIRPAKEHNGRPHLRGSALMDHMESEGDGDMVDEEAASRAQFIASHQDAQSMLLASGDVMLCLANAADLESLAHHPHFYVASVVGSVPPPVSIVGALPVFLFVLMIALVASGVVDMTVASMMAAGLFLLVGWVAPRDIPQLVDVKLLMLMGCALSFAKSLSACGLSSDLALLIKSMDVSAQGSLFIVYLVTLLVTEMVSNNAAAALMFPVAMALADELNANFLPFAMVVLIAATAAFMSPIGYQTHVMVWGPGGYTFTDFVKFGLIPNLIFWLGTCLLAPVIYPL